VKVVNTILWDEKREFEGDGFDVEYSCVRNGFAGEGNIDDDPLFVDVDKPKGNVDCFGTENDGLMLKKGSPCIDRGTDMKIETDIAKTSRPLGKEVDMGAYEISVPPNIPQVGFGILNLDGEFIVGNGIGEIAVKVDSKNDLYKLLYGRSALTLRFYHPKNSNSDGIDSGDVYIFFQKDNQIVSGQRLVVRFYRQGVDDNNSNYIYTTRKFVNGKFIGKPIFLVAETDTNKIKALEDNNRYHILPVVIGEVKLKAQIYTQQFK
jgi:hypothetical protein